MKLYVYPAVLFTENDEHFIDIPDLNLMSVANSAEDAFIDAKKSLKAYFELAKRFDSDVPYPSTFEDVCKKNPKKKVVMIDVAVEGDQIEQTEEDKEYNKFMKMFFDEN